MHQNDRGTQFFKWFARFFTFMPGIPFLAWALLAPLFWAGEVRAEDRFEFHLFNDFSATYNNVSGDGADNSTLTEGGNYLNTLSLYGNGSRGDLVYDFQFGAKITDDQNYDIRKYSMTNFTVNMATPQHAFSVGDTFQAFSQYSLTSALKGAAYKYLGGQDPYAPRVTFVYGLAAPRWDSIWGNKETEVIERQVYGTRVELAPSPLLAMGVSIVGMDDGDPVIDFERIYDGMVYAVDVRYRPIPGLSLYGEAAANDAHARMAGDEAGKEKLEGHAVKLQAIGDEDPSRVTIEYERVSPEFENPVGSANPDREKVKFGWRYKATEDVHLFTNMLWYHDDLENQKDVAQTDYYRPELAVAWLRPFDRRYGYAKLTYNKKIAEQGGDRVKDDDLVYLNYRDRFGVIDMDTNLGYNFYEKHGTSKLDTDEFIYNTVLRSRFTTRLAVFKPAVYLGGWNFSDDVLDNEDRFYEYSVGLGIDVPELNLTSNVKVGRNRLQKEDNDDSTKTFGALNVYWRPDFMATLDQTTIYLQAYVNNFNFEAANEDFREESVTVGIAIQY